VVHIHSRRSLASSYCFLRSMMSPCYVPGWLLFTSLLLCPCMESGPRSPASARSVPGSSNPSQVGTPSPRTIREDLPSTPFRTWILIRLLVPHSAVGSSFGCWLFTPLRRLLCSLAKCLVVCSLYHSSCAHVWRVVPVPLRALVRFPAASSPTW
jgi:hypothetical protein